MATTVTAYASANADPISFPDVDLSLAQAALPFLAEQLHGAAFDSANPSNTFWAWSWAILDDDSPTNPGVLSSAVVKDPKLDVPTWHNIRLFLIVQNTVTSVFSEQDPLLAPDSAFVHARVLSTTASLEKLADGERNYGAAFHALVAQVEADAIGPGAHTVASHSDTTATGAELDTLTDNSSATGLHTHAGPDVALATASARGAVLLEETGGGSGAVITRERVQLDASVDGTRTTTGGWVAGQILPATYEADQTISGGKPLAIWKADELLTILKWAIQLVDGGGTGVTHKYSFRLGVANKTQLDAGTWAALDIAIGGEPTVSGNPLAVSRTFASPYVLAVDSYIGLFCLAAPRVLADADVPGGGLTAQVFARREVV